MNPPGHCTFRAVRCAVYTPEGELLEYRYEVIKTICVLENTTILIGRRGRLDEPRPGALDSLPPAERRAALEVEKDAREWLESEAEEGECVMTGSADRWLIRGHDGRERITYADPRRIGDGLRQKGD